MRFGDNGFVGARLPFLFISAVLSSFLMFGASAVRGGDDVRQSDDDARYLIKQSDKLVRKGQLEEAEKILRQLIAQSPTNSTAKLKLAFLVLKQKKLLEAYEISFEIAKAEPKNSFAFAVLGATLLNAGNFREAEAVLVNALKIDKEEALAWAGLGMLDFYENRLDDAIGNLRNATYLESGDPDYIFSLAQVSARAERYKEAAEAYRRFLVVSSSADRERRDRIKGLINFLTFLGQRSSLYDVGGASSETVKIELIRDRPLVTVRINRSDEPLRFILDTGSGISVISRETAERLDVKSVTRGGLARAIGGNGRFEIIYGFLRNVDIGGVRVRNVPVYIRDFHLNDERIDGYIGLSLISKFLTTIDYGKKEFSLVRKDVAEELGLVPNDALFQPLRLTSSGFLSGEVQLEGLENNLNFIVDTGASVSVISDELAVSEQIRGFAQDETMRVIGAAGVTEGVKSFLLPRVTFGSHSRESVKAVALDLDVINEASGFRQSGILGGNFLKNYRLTFDFKNSKVIFSPIEK